MSINHCMIQVRMYVTTQPATVKCEKFTEGTLGTPDIKSRPTRCQKGLQLQLMCCTPFRLLFQDFGTGRLEIGDWRLEDQSKYWGCSWSRT